MSAIRAMEASKAVVCYVRFTSRLCKNFRAFSHEPVPFAFARP
jgi:hypothetical protein